jgi:hypothetical protein
MPKRKGHRHLPKKHKRIRTKYPTLNFNESSRMYVCLTCKEELHDAIPKEWAPWEIPRHVKKTHKVANTKDLRMKFIPSWNKTFEKEYIDNLHREIIFELEEKNSVETSTKLLNKMAKEDQERRKRELEAERDSR